MFKRLFWFTTGALIGMVFCLWALRTARAKVRRLAPSSVAGQVSAGARSFFDDLRDAAAEGRVAMREREAELRAELERARSESVSLGRSRPALPGNPSLN